MTWNAPTRRRCAAAALALALAAAAASTLGPATAATSDDQATGAVPRPAACGAQDKPETALQGQVPLADRESGRSKQGYSCNLSLIGQYQGIGATWVDPQYGHCAYMGSALPATLAGKGGVHVVDASDPRHPRNSATLDSPAFLSDTWESLKTNQARGLLAGVAVDLVLGAAFFDVYDIATDCAHPKLLNSVNGERLTLPANVLGHEGTWSPDGRTYWASGLAAGSLTAIDVSDPAHPRMAWTGSFGQANHGFELSPDGNRLYLTTLAPAGFVVLDTSQVQAHAANPQVRQVGQATWTDGLFSQHTIPVTVNGKPWIIAIDEGGHGGVHFVDVADEAKPVVHPGIRLEIQQPEHADARNADDARNGAFHYQTHYCSVDRRTDPTALACGFFDSGIRVFDIRNLAHPREIAYFNPPARAGEAGTLPGSQHQSWLGFYPGFTSPDDYPGVFASDFAKAATDGPVPNWTSDWCSSPPAFVGRQLWVTCQDNGFLTLAFAPGVYPLKGRG
jgi:hypothetical protein